MTSVPEHTQQNSATLAGGHAGTEETGPGSGKGKNANGPVSSSLGYVLDGPCSCCGGHMVRLLRCRCSCLGVFHEIRKDGTRGKCASGGLDGCACKQFEEAGC